VNIGKVVALWFVCSLVWAQPPQTLEEALEMSIRAYTNEESDPYRLTLTWTPEVLRLLKTNASMTDPVRALEMKGWILSTLRFVDNPALPERAGTLANAVHGYVSYLDPQTVYLTGDVVRGLERALLKVNPPAPPLPPYEHPRRPQWMLDRLPKPPKE
jgi:hypothetical protein